MANSLLSKDQISNIDPGWSHPVLPGHAVQGSLLLTRSDFVNPPQSSDMFIWKPMEDLVGIHDIRFKYYESDNTYHIYKTYGHLNNNDEWIEDVYDIGHFAGLTQEAAENLEKMKYLKYTFTFQDNVYKIEGLLKDGTSEKILEIQIPTLKEFQDEVEARKSGDEGLTETLNTEIETRTQLTTNLRNDLTTESQTRLDKDNELSTKLTQEIADRTSEDANIKADITQKVEYAIQYALNVVSQLNQEVEERKANDKVIQDNLTTEITNRTNQDNAINQTMQNNYNTLDAKINSVAGSAITTKVVDVLPETKTNNTMYYVKTAEGVYEMYLYSNDTLYDMGTTQIDLTPYQTKAQAQIEHDELEAKITTAGGDITTITDNVNNLTTQTTQLTTAVNKNTADIATNKANIETNKTNIATNTTNIANNTASINTLKTTVASYKPIAGDQINISTTSTGSTIALKGTSETWTFTLQDGSTVDRTVRYF